MYFIFQYSFVGVFLKFFFFSLSWCSESAILDLLPLQPSPSDPVTTEGFAEEFSGCGAPVFIIESPLADKTGYYISPIDSAGRMIEGSRWSRQQGNQLDKIGQKSSIDNIFD